ncbi:MAG: hypothetical protein O3B43_06075 [Chloroflexi bacterium]|nr:hypothetical protein [Chloroflexota bacterium]
MSKLETNLLKRVLRSIISTRNEELDCSGCFEQLEQFVERELEGMDVGEAMPLVRLHLDRCDGCCQEYEALLDALSGVELSV